MRDRINRLYLHSINHRAEVGSFATRVAAFNETLEREFSRGSVLWGLVEWHNLIGSTPTDNLPTVDQETRDSVLSKMVNFLAAVEEEWQLT